MFLQGCRRVFKSGPAEEAIECRRHERGESVRGGLFPLSLGGLGVCVFNGGFMHLGSDYSRFGHKDISCRVRNRMLDKIVFSQSHVFIYFFFLTCFLDIISSMSPQGLAKYF